MNPDLIIILISGFTGLFLGALLGFSINSVLSARAVMRAEKHAWAAANLFYSRKDNPS